MAKSNEFIKFLNEYSDKYILECLANTKQVVSGSGKVIDVRDRHIPTTLFFLNIWLPMISKTTIVRSTYYLWLKSDDELKSDTIKSIDEKFKALAADIVANEGKGIFYAKNKLGWTDRVQESGEKQLTLKIVDESSSNYSTETTPITK
jgi:hypothetical protein